MRLYIKDFAMINIKHFDCNKAQENNRRKYRPIESNTNLIARFEVSLHCTLCKKLSASEIYILRELKIQTACRIGPVDNYLFQQQARLHILYRKHTGTRGSKSCKFQRSRARPAARNFSAIDAIEIKSALMPLRVLHRADPEE